MRNYCMYKVTEEHQQANIHTSIREVTRDNIPKDVLSNVRACPLLILKPQLPEHLKLQNKSRVVALIEQNKQHTKTNNLGRYSKTHCNG